MPTTHSLTESLFTADGVQALDRFLIEDQGVDGYGLMQKAARAAFRQLMRHWPDAASVLVLCGAGNNGGDGYLVALNALRQGLAVDCIAVADPQKLSGDARRAWRDAEQAGVAIRQWQAVAGDERIRLFDGSPVVVDAMLGTGVRGQPRAPFDEVVRQVNASGCPVLAVDVPSGLDASRGVAEGDAVKADVTVTFIGQKLGLLTGEGPHFAGTVIHDTLGAERAPADFPVEAVASLAGWSRCREWLPPLSRSAHKGVFGHVLVVAGDRGFGGAGLLAAEAAARSGAGLVSLATRPEHVAPALSRCPSLMVRGVVHGNELAPLLEKADVVVCGPGLGQFAWGEQMLQQVLEAGKPRLLDADALNLMAHRMPVVSDEQVITPHPGEAARLLSCSVAEIEADRLAAVRSLQQRFGGLALLKGAGTLVAAPDQLPVLVAGANPGMATGGMGDVLSGILGAFMAQATRSGALSLADGVVLGASLHLAAADSASRSKGSRGLLPMDVIDALPGVLGAAETRVEEARVATGEVSDD
ncbi:NAD(P)H-hydrate dehydratase [Marinobacter bryozoorum]|uniref:NAD(P)H-hydrate dehydratase n=1 Tax=Marinobacter bryozoorum TaxID=256324 RepID=UPI002003BB16|nr:NAD(P)H-hydrate dehydratase [Marinobacter bryozoorum]MCK7542847.1 NAD(P)H-hydrate dehydratase [Marinobacter bryozoorum]